MSAIFFGSCSNSDEDILNISTIDKTFEAPISYQEIAFPDSEKELTTFHIENQDYNIAQYDSLYIFQGDILLTKEQLNNLKKLGNPNSKTTTISEYKYRWNNGIIYYTFHSEIAQLTKQQIKEAMAIWETSTSIRFKERTNQVDYVEFFNGNGNYSHYGKIGGKQQISISRTQGNKGSAIHEIGHAVGLFHEQSRKDRDQYINVIYNNIQPSSYHNFDFPPIKNEGIYPIDFGSVMIYSPFNNFSINPNLPTLTKKDGTTWLAQRDGLSLCDKMGVAFIYDKLEFDINTIEPNNSNPNRPIGKDIIKVTCPMSVKIGQSILITAEYTRIEGEQEFGARLRNPFMFFRANVSIAPNESSHKMYKISNKIRVHEIILTPTKTGPIEVSISGEKTTIKVVS